MAANPKMVAILPTLSGKCYHIGLKPIIKVETFEVAILPHQVLVTPQFEVKTNSN